MLTKVFTEKDSVTYTKSRKVGMHYIFIGCRLKQSLVRNLIHCNTFHYNISLSLSLTIEQNGMKTRKHKQIVLLTLS